MFGKVKFRGLVGVSCAELCSGLGVTVAPPEAVGFPLIPASRIMIR